MVAREQLPQRLSERLNVKGDGPDDFSPTVGSSEYSNCVIYSLFW